MTRTFDEIQDSIDRLFSPFPQVVNFQTRVRRLASTPLRDAEPNIVLLIGESGVGKTRMLKQTQSEFPRIEYETFTEIPVLYVRVPADCTYSNLIMTVLHAFETPLISSGADRNRMQQIKTLITNCRVRLLILDDANQMVDRGRSKSHYRLGDWVREIADETRVRLVIAGVPRLWRMITTNEQLRSRVSQQIVVEPFTASAQDKNPIDLALAAFDSCLADIHRVQLTSELTSRRFAHATAGRLRSLRNLLVNAVEIALESPKRQIDYGVLARAFRQTMFPGAPPERNPFSTKFNGRPLTGRGEPFDPNSGEFLND
jgi:Cdc6-like AAA superfamily ATPase